MPAVRARRTKGKRWAKGGSSSSNPEIKQHRVAARTGFYAGEKGSTALTVSALSQFNDAAAVDSDNESLAGPKSVGAVTSASLMSCSFDGTVFEQVQQKWNSPHASHREACAVLAAVSEVVSSARTGKVVETEYFAALMTALENTSDSESLAAIAYLLSLIIEKVPQNVLRAKFSMAAKLFMTAANQHSEAGSSAFHRAVVRCLGVLLQAQEPAVWSNSSTLSVFRVLLVYTADSRPKVRKGAHEWVVKLIKSPLADASQPPFHPGCSALAKSCAQVLEDSTGNSESTPALHVLRLLREVLGLLPIQSVKMLCEHILRLLTLCDVITTSLCMQALHGLFSAKPKATSLSAELCAQLITSLYEYQPHVNDVQPCLAWLAVMQAAHVHLAGLDARLGSGHLQRVCGTAYQFLLSEKDLVRQGSAEFLIILLRQAAVLCVPVMASHLSSAPNVTVTQAHRLFRCFEAGLQYSYHSAWDLTLQVLGVAFEVMGKELHSVMTKGLRSLCDLHETQNFPYRRQLEAAVSAAVTAMGPKVFLGAVPLKLEEKEVMTEFPRAWLLPVFKDAIKRTDLAFFASYFLPLAVRLRATAGKLVANQQKLEATLYTTLELQIWRLLPGFCTEALDLTTAFRSVARVIGTALQQRLELIPTICTSLAHVIASANASSEFKMEVGSFSKNFLPILFGLVTRGLAEGESEEPLSDDTRAFVLDCVRSYVSITDAKLVTTFSNQVCQKLGQDDTPRRLRQALADLAIAMAPHVPASIITAFFKVAAPHLQNTLDSGMQKKAFQLLEVICSSENGEAFISNHVGEIEKLLLASQSVTSAGAKRPRLKCIRHIAGKVNGLGGKQFITAMLPEVMLCSKEVNEKTRLLGYAVLVEMAQATQRITQKSVEDSTEEFLVMLSGGLVGSSHMASATVNSMAKLTVLFRAHVQSGLLEKLLGMLPSLLMSRHREVVKSTLILVKVLIGVVGKVQLREHLQAMITTLLGWSSDSQSHFRMKARVVFERLIRKFGYDDVARYVPVKDMKLITHIRKTNERAKRKKAERRESGEDGKRKSKRGANDDDSDTLFSSDEDEPMESGFADQQSGGSTRRKAWIKEGGTDDPLDLLDPSSSRKVLATKPHVKRQESRESEFAVQDGKLLIDDEGQEQATTPAGVIAMGMESETNTSPWSATKGKKRRRGDDDDDDDDDRASSRGGGSGIHRRLPSKQARDAEGGRVGAGSEYRAKKAGGDVKKKNKPDPYSYVPLSFNMLNRRLEARRRQKKAPLLIPSMQSWWSTRCGSKKTRSY